MFISEYMILLNYKKENHRVIISACVNALKQGKVVAYPTDTSFGLAVDSSNLNAIKKLYKIKGRDFKKPVHIIPPSLNYIKKIVDWNKIAQKLASKFFPGALTLVLPLRIKDKGLTILSARSGYIGIRMPKNEIALDLAKYLKKPITTTSANLSGMPDCFSVLEIVEQFQNSKFKPDIIINAGKLIKRKPSTVVKTFNNQVEILRQGPISKKDIEKVLGFGF